MTNYKTTECYKTCDGMLFECEKAAAEHADNLLGEELDGLLKLASLDITRIQEYKALLAWMSNRRELKTTINKIHSIINFEYDND